MKFTAKHFSHSQCSTQVKAKQQKVFRVLGEKRHLLLKFQVCTLWFKLFYLTMSVLFTDHVRSTKECNVFEAVCDFVWGRGCMVPPPGGRVPPVQVLSLGGGGGRVHPFQDVSGSVGYILSS